MNFINTRQYQIIFTSHCFLALFWLEKANFGGLSLPDQKTQIAQYIVLRPFHSPNPYSRRGVSNPVSSALYKSCRMM
jgi:hypothetical protein